MTAWSIVRENCANNCAVRINAGITALVPVIDQAQHALPTLQQYLPPNIYGWGFIMLAIANIVLHIRIPAPPNP